ncbi:MAG: glycosyltransferase family 4 protein [Chloroflexi bacterium]|nr:MAG: glycosyltransferase family 4 protein [Chloroflexota bacterium]MBL1192845.1 glycosyltransferase family 4 protein [Chloroflexota bacterium]NOH10138.1 glycosyltransferase family 4 protein [Chloroflexota bacterium]
MKVLYFSRDYTPHDHRFLSALAESEHDVYYLRLERRGHQQEDREPPANVHIVQWDGGQKAARFLDGPRLLSGLRKVIRQVKPDLIHAGPIQTVGLLAVLSGFHPLVTMSWGSDLLLDAAKNAWYRWATRYVLKHSDVLIGDCETVKHKAVDYGMPPEDIVTFPWGVDLEHFSPGESRLRSQQGWGDAFVLLHTRTWAPLYGVDVFAKAFVQAARQIPELHLFMLGGGPLAQQIRGIFNQSGIQERVHFAGQVALADLPEYYRAADLYVSASHSDGSSVSLMEALACGTPVIVSEIPSNAEWVTEGVQGWCFADGDVDALTETILDAYENRQQLPKVSQAARQQAETRADWTKNSKKLLRAYDLAINNQ